MEEALIQQLRERVLTLASDDQDAKHAAEMTAMADDSAILTRLLLARKRSIDEAFKLAGSVISWRGTIQPGALTPADAPIAIPQGTWRFMGLAKNGMPILQVRACCWVPAEYSVEEYVNYVGYFMEQACQRMGPGASKIVIIFDMKDMAYLKVPTLLRIPLLLLL